MANRCRAAKPRIKANRSLNNPEPNREMAAIARADLEMMTVLTASLRLAGAHETRVLPVLNLFFFLNHADLLFPRLKILSVFTRYSVASALAGHRHQDILEVSPNCQIFQHLLVHLCQQPGGRHINLIYLRQPSNTWAGC